MTPWLRTVIGIVIVIVLGVGGLFLYQMSQSRNNDYGVIASKWTKSGKFIDYSEDLGVKTAKDINFYVNYDEEQVEIGYGYVQLVYTFAELDEDKIRDDLKYIGLTYEKNKKGDKYRFYWKGEQVEEWAHSNNVG